MPSQNELTAKDRLIAAVDIDNIEQARQWIEELREEVGVFKFGLEAWANFGNQLFDIVKRENVRCFFDCKLHDIPNTVYGASRAIVKRGVYMFNVHASGGSQMMQAAAQAAKEHEDSGYERPLVIAVTILTSINRSTLEEEIGVSRSLEATVGKMAMVARNAGLDGVVASGKEAASIRQLCGRDFLIITPGIRPKWAADDDQKRILTPAQALQNGADYIVVGRPITKAGNKKDAARKIVWEMETALGG